MVPFRRRPRAPRPSATGERNPGPGGADFRSRPLRCLAFVAMALLAGQVLAAGAPEQLFTACSACHGADAAGNTALGAPALAGQLPVYLERQLHMFRRGLRGGVAGDSYGAQMQPFAAQLPDDEAIAALSAWLGALAPAAPSGQSWEGDGRRGASLYNGNCGACHGCHAEGNAALKAPRLAGLDPAYLQRQVLNFQSGVRGGNARDRLGRQMAMMAATLTAPQDLDGILAYIAGLPAPAPGPEATPAP